MPEAVDYNIDVIAARRTAPVKLNEVLRTLKSMGTAQNVKVYKRHGAGDNLFGVSFAHLNKLKRQINHQLATELWKTGNTDAMSLATMIADPAQLTSTAADGWLKGISYGLLAELLGGVVARSKLGLSKFKKWSKSKEEITRQCSYSVLAHLLQDDASQVPDALCKETLTRIEKEIHAAPNRARQAMNNALISIGVYKPQLQAPAIAACRRIGQVFVDYGETGCKTPDAEAYIKKTAKRTASRKPSR